MKQEMTEEEIKEIAAQLRKPEGEKGKEIAQLMNEGNQAMNLHSLAVLNPQANESILEIGMGNGHFVKNIVNLDKEISYMGCDYSKHMVEEAKKVNEKLMKHKSVDFVEANISCLPFEDETFDKVLTINTFYFWEDHISVLKELKRVLKKEGSLVLAVRPKHNLKEFPVTQYNFSLVENEEILELLKACGFNRIALTEINEPPQEHYAGHKERASLIFSCQELEPETKT